MKTGEIAAAPPRNVSVDTTALDGFPSDTGEKHLRDHALSPDHVSWGKGEQIGSRVKCTHTSSVMTYACVCSFTFNTHVCVCVSVCV